MISTAREEEKLTLKYGGPHQKFSVNMGLLRI
jgi:hypothetical protein